MSYYSTVMRNKPIRYYRLNETSGTVAHDSGSQASDGTYTNGPTLGVASLLPGTPDTEVQFAAGTFQQVFLPTTGLPSGAAPWTTEIWADIVSPVANGGSALCLGSFVAGELISIESRTGNLWRFSTYGAYSDLLSQSSSVAYNTMHHLVATYDGTTITFYLDGVSFGGGAVTMSITYGIAYLGAGDADFNGITSEAAIYNYALSADQIKVDYQVGVSGNIVRPSHRAFARIQ